MVLQKNVATIKLYGLYFTTGVSDLPDKKAPKVDCGSEQSAMSINTGPSTSPIFLTNEFKFCGEREILKVDAIFLGKNLI